ncbi:MAG: ribosomal-processing cysteine protease Prp [Clostridia bacterium]|nr:ribosomal-processing cysteine protease Prp [Clostridia bacterium]
MIQARLTQDSKGNITAFEGKGHSGYAESGSDIVCAAVSVLSCTCVNALESVLGIRPNIWGGDDGFLAFTLPELDDAAMDRAQILMKALKQGLDDVACEYPRNLHVSIQRLSTHERRKST